MTRSRHGRGSHELNISVGLMDGGLNVWREHLTDGTYEPGLPASVRHVLAGIESWSSLVRDHYTWVDDVDVTKGWASAAARAEFLEHARGLERELQAALGPAWRVQVSPEPGITRVRLMGEYGVDWPLWTVDMGASNAEDWPMLSAGLKERLRMWAEVADPGSGKSVDERLTAKLLEELRSELGSTFDVV